MHVIVYDDFVANVRATYCKTLDFLGVDSTRIQSDFQAINGNKSVKHPALRSLLNEPFLRSTAVAMARRLPCPIFAALHDLDRLLWRLNSRPEKRPVMVSELRARLQHEFASEVEQLSELLGRDLTHWSRAVSDGREGVITCAASISQSSVSSKISSTLAE